MTGGIFSIVTLCALAGLLLVAAATDIHSRTILNSVNATIALIAPLYWWSSGMAAWPDMATQVGLSLIVFVVFAAVFAAGMMGGGDVKLIAALALWLPPVPLLQMLMVMAVAGGVITLTVLVIHKLRKLNGTPEIPYGVAIAFAGLWAISERYLNQFA